MALFGLFGKKDTALPAPRAADAPVQTQAAPARPSPPAPENARPPAGPEAALAGAGEADTTLETEEAAILFANGQFDVAERMLRAATEDAPGSPSEPPAWWMLFDLYEARGQMAQFEALALAYARCFERSPPAWPEAAGAPAGASPSSGSAPPAISFSGLLDEGGTRQLERLRKLGAEAPALRLDFSRLSGITAPACQQLWEVLQFLGARPTPLLLLGADVLLEQLRPLMHSGPEAAAAPWLLHLEILRLQNQPDAFEEASMEYCLAFEVSPPSFVAPPVVETAAATAAGPDAAPASPHFPMPPVLEGQVDGLMAALSRHAAEHDPLVLDCARLSRVDFNAAGQLLSCLAPLAGRSIELHHVSHLVATLFEVIGLKDIARIQLRRR